MIKRTHTNTSILYSPSSSVPQCPMKNPLIWHLVSSTQFLKPSNCFSSTIWDQTVELLKTSRWKLENNRIGVINKSLHKNRLLHKQILPLEHQNNSWCNVCAIKKRSMNQFSILWFLNDFCDSECLKLAANYISWEILLIKAMTLISKYGFSMQIIRYIFTFKWE